MPAHEQELGEEAPPFAQSRELGFWIYLMSDAVIFALLFATFAVMSTATDGGPAASGIFRLDRAFLETMALLASSVSFGMAALAYDAGRTRRCQLWLGVTFLLGAAFVALELGEFTSLVAAGAGPQRSGFLSAFFVLVGTHGLHVSAGMLWIAAMAAQLSVYGRSPAVSSRMQRLGMFWHFLDIVWIGIFSFVYLLGITNG